MPLSSRQIFVLLFVLCYGTLAFLFLQSYFVFDANVLLGAILFPVILYLSAEEKTSYKYVPLLLVFLAMAIYTQTKSFYYLSWLVSLLFLFDTLLGNTGYVGFILGITISPVFKYFGSSVGFEIRLWLSKVSANLLSVLGYKTSVEGNTILLNDVSYAVDQACVGLNMLSASFIQGTFMIAWFTHQYQRQFSGWQVAILMVFILLLNVISNLLRIFTLTIFDIPPGNVLHDVAGALCFVVYTIVPFYGLLTFAIGKAAPRKKSSGAVNLYRLSAYQVLLIFLLAGIGTYSKKEVSPELLAQPHLCNTQFETEKLNNGVWKMSNDSALVYIKPMSGFASAEHNPMICWKGSGYEFQKIDKDVIAGFELYKGTLKRGEDILHTAWWIEVDTLKTIHQLEWRKEAMLSNRLPMLVNVTTANEDALHVQCRQLLLRPLKCK